MIWQVSDRSRAIGRAALAGAGRALAAIVYARTRYGKDERAFCMLVKLILKG